MPYDTLDLTGMRLEEAHWAGSVLRVNFGGGYGAQANVGHDAGLHLWTLHSGGIWPDNSTNGLTISAKTRFAYYWEFFQSHTTGTDIFIIAFRSKNYHASFVDTSMDVTRFRKTLDIYESGGIKIRQRRVVGVTYASDGSIP